MAKRLLLIASVVAALMLAGIAQDQSLRVAENLRHEAVILPPSTPDRKQLVAVDYAVVADEELEFGIVVVYDDRRTNRQTDYIEFYDFFGDLVMVSWIDRFGICQTAIDRGLLDREDPTIERQLVLVTGGIAA
jgi:hypothetical protein